MTKLIKFTLIMLLGTVSSVSLAASPLPKDEYADNPEDFFSYYSSFYNMDDLAQYDGYFANGNKKFPISLLFYVTSDFSIESCTYVNRTYKTRLEMNVDYTRHEMVLTSKSAKNRLTIHLTPVRSGLWEGWAEQGGKTLKVTVRPAGKP